MSDVEIIKLLRPKWYSNDYIMLQSRRHVVLGEIIGICSLQELNRFVISYLSIYICLSIYLSIPAYVSNYQPTFLSIYLPIFLFISYLSFCQSIYLSICMYLLDTISLFQYLAGEKLNILLILDASGASHLIVILV